MKGRTKAMNRKQMAAAKRQAVLSSPAFQEWYAARMGIHPVPSDPYRAYMIDIALQAKVLPKPHWQVRTPRSDYPDVDLPEMSPAAMRRMPHKIPAFRGIPLAAKPRERHPFEKVLEEHREKFIKKHGISPVEIRAERGLGSVGAGYYWAGAEEIGIKPHIRVGIRDVPKIFKKGKKWHPLAAQVLASFKHELGHHGSRKGIVGVPAAYFEQPKLKGIYTTPRRKEEKQAWAIGDPFLQEFRQLQKWRGKIMLATYLQPQTIEKWKYEYTPRKPK